MHLPQTTGCGHLVIMQLQGGHGDLWQQPGQKHGAHFVHRTARCAFGWARKDLRCLVGSRRAMRQSAVGGLGLVSVGAGFGLCRYHGSYVLLMGFQPSCSRLPVVGRAAESVLAKLVMHLCGV